MTKMMKEIFASMMIILSCMLAFGDASDACIVCPTDTTATKPCPLSVADCESYERCAYTCPALSRNKVDPACPSSFDDCRCRHGHSKEYSSKNVGYCKPDESCTARCDYGMMPRYVGLCPKKPKNDCICSDTSSHFQCPPFSVQNSRKCPESSDDCKCIKGYVMKNGGCILKGAAGFKSKTAKCLAVTGKQKTENRVNVIIVPSGFILDFDTFRTEAWKHYKEFLKHETFNVEDIKQLNMWFANPGSDDVNESFCEFWQGTRALTCEENRAFEIAEEACGSMPNMEILVLHNSKKYGGTGGLIGTTTINESGPKISVHELGHSYLDLADEYYDELGGGDSWSANCAEKGCERWGDMLGKHGIGCFPSKCRGGNFFTSLEFTQMNILDAPFGAVNERISCCKYLSYKSSPVPKFCRKFKTLRKYCETSNWKSGGPFDDGIDGIGYDANRAIDLVAPVKYAARLNSSTGAWAVSFVSDLAPGLYDASLVEGDCLGNIEDVLIVKVHPGGKQIACFKKEVQVHVVPPAPGSDDDEIHDAVFHKRSAFNFIAEMNDLENHSYITIE